jgi:hypothetical protein
MDQRMCGQQKTDQETTPMDTYRIKIYSIVLSAFVFFGTAFGQEEPRILLNEGEMKDTTIIGINGSHFGVKIDWGQRHLDTLKYEIVHGRGKVAMDLSRGKQMGIPEEFDMHDIRRVRPGNKLAFNIELNGKKISKLFYVLSTKASETKPWFFNVYFVLNGDTLTTDKYEALFLYPKDSLNQVAPRLERAKYPKFTRYFFQLKKNYQHRLSLSSMSTSHYMNLSHQIFSMQTSVYGTSNERNEQERRGWISMQELNFQIWMQRAGVCLVHLRTIIKIGTV